MNKIVFVGDIHGNLGTINKVQERYQDWRKIFVGDILDSFFNTVEEQIACLTILRYMVANENTDVIFGNHEVSYMFPNQRCSGHNPETQLHFDYDGPKDIRRKFKWYVSFEHAGKHILVTHAGLSAKLLRINKISPNIKDIEIALDDWAIKFMRQQPSPFDWYSRIRGGVDPVGGPLWCDYGEFEDIPGIIQVFGHTPGAYLRQAGESWCIDIREDILERKVLELVDGIFTVRPLT